MGVDIKVSSVYVQSIHSHKIQGCGSRNGSGKTNGPNQIFTIVPQMYSLRNMGPYKVQTDH